MRLYNSWDQLCGIPDASHCTMIIHNIDLHECIVINGDLDLDLDQTMPNVELVRAIFISYNIFTV